MDQIKAAQLAARKAKDHASSVLTTLIGEAEMVGKNAGREVSEAEIVAKLKKFVDNIDETIGHLKEAGTSEVDEAIVKLKAERDALVAHMPKQLTVDEIKAHVRDIHAGLLAAGLEAKMGSIMSMLKTRFEGLYDGKVASAAIKEELETK
jgi:uncharacterized protein YqeY